MGYAVQPVDMSQVSATAQGLIAQNGERAYCSGTAAALVTGTAYYQSVSLLVGQVISTVHLMLAVNAAAQTFGKVGLYSKSGTLRAASADFTENWESAVGGAAPRLASHAFEVAYTIPTTDLYFVAVLAVFTSTAPQLFRLPGPISPNAAVSVGIGSGARAYGSQASQADLPASFTQSGTAPLPFWVGLS